MSYLDKVHKKAQAEKMIAQIMSSQQYKEAKRQENLQTFALLCLVTCDFLELNHRYKTNGLLKWLRFAEKRMKYIAEDDEGYCEAMNDYIRDAHGIDVLASLGVKIGKEGAENGKS